MSFSTLCITKNNPTRFNNNLNNHGLDLTVSNSLRTRFSIKYPSHKQSNSQTRQNPASTQTQRLPSHSRLRNLLPSSPSWTTGRPEKQGRLFHHSWRQWEKGGWRVEGRSKGVGDFLLKLRLGTMQLATSPRGVKLMEAELSSGRENQGQK